MHVVCNSKQERRAFGEGGMQDTLMQPAHGSSDVVRAGRGGIVHEVASFGEGRRHAETTNPKAPMANTPHSQLPKEVLFNFP